MEKKLYLILRIIINYFCRIMLIIYSQNINRWKSQGKTKSCENAVFFHFPEYFVFHSLFQIVDLDAHYNIWGKIVSGQVWVLGMKKCCSVCTAVPPNRRNLSSFGSHVFLCLPVYGKLRALNLYFVNTFLCLTSVVR